MKSVTVYLDLIFLTNVFFDAAMIMLTAAIRRCRIPRWRIAVASMVGAAYTVLMFFPAYSIMFTVFSKIIFALFLVYVAVDLCK